MSKEFDKNRHLKLIQELRDENKVLHERVIALENVVNGMNYFLNGGQE